MTGRFSAAQVASQQALRCIRGADAAADGEHRIYLRYRSRF